MKVKQFRDHFYSELSDQYPKTEIQTFLLMVLEEYLNFQRIDLVTKGDFEIETKILEQLQKVVVQLKKQRPIQYILRKTEFYGLPFLVNEHVLIPRPETEELVEWILLEVGKVQSFKGTKVQSDALSEVEARKISILDIGTGSACIPVALKKNIPNATISGIDISKDALEVAQQNAYLNEVEIEFIEKDILKTERLHKKYNIIVSNPPYVRELEKAEIKANVLENEPHLALFVEDHDPLVFYRKIAELAKDHIKENGLLFFEINQYLGKEMLEMMHLLGFQNVVLKKDLFGNDRMIKATLCK
jgi:release factor glutamine methyltransferase